MNIFRKNNIKLFFILFLSKTFAQNNIKFYAEQIADGYAYFADNEELFPVSSKFDFKLENLKSTNGNNKVFVIPAKSKKYLVTHFLIINQQIKYGFSSNIFSVMGDVINTKYDTSFKYFLPFKKGENFKIFQGYFGSFSHKNENALDFSMPIDTDICAVRDGLVVKVVTNNTKSCFEEDCKKYNNYILVLHTDGSFADYSHINTNSSLVSVGDQVKQGNVIAKSGNVGYSSGPHLHLAVFKPKITGRNTLRTNFLIDDGKKTSILTQNSTYFRNY